MLFLRYILQQEAVVALERTALYAENQEGMAMIEDYRKAVEG